MNMTFQTDEDAIFKKSPVNQPQQLDQAIKLDQISTNIHNNAGITSICGLSNLGNTCFMNASLQCLLGTKSLKKVIIQRDFKINVSLLMLEFMQQLQDIFVKVESGNYLILHLKSFHQVISKLHPVFGNFKQHDSQEFLSFVLNSIHDELNLKKPIITSEELEEKVSSTTDWITNGVAKRLKMDKVSLEASKNVNCESMQTVDEHAWSNYLANNESVISTTMQGQFQSIVSCDKCAYVSYTYEPFMFLSLPIPYAMEKEIVLTWVPSTELLMLQGKPSIKRYLVLVNKDGTLKDLKDKFLMMLRTDDSSIINQNVVLAQVVNSGNVNILDERTLLSYLSVKIDFYAIEVVQPSGCVKQFDDPVSESKDIFNKKSEVLSWHVCSICLEEVFDERLTIHPPCGGMMCGSCLEVTTQYHHNENFACPTCNHQIISNDYKQFVEPGSNDAIIRKVLVPVLFRRKSESTKLELFGHPTIFSLYSQTDSNFIRDLVQSVVLSLNSTSNHSNFDIVITNAAGVRCGQCEQSDTCTGCLIGDFVKLKPGNCITVHFNHGNIDQIVQMDKSMSHRRNLSFVTLDECVAKFSEIEHLTCECAWYCPKCRCNQPAVKRMTVSRWPDVLIVHLKRFHYKDGKGCKIQSLIDFPLSKFMPSVLCANKIEKNFCPEYELYACICHSGTLNGGHYTSFVKHEDKWYYFNDDNYTQLEPSESNRDGVYVLFYQKAGLEKTAEDGFIKKD